MNNKYYVPEISDIHVGYECEINPSPKLNPYNWNKHIVAGNRVFMSDDFYRIHEWVSHYETLETYMRTSYLTREQIEAEGWKRIEQSETESAYYRKEGNYNTYFVLRQIIHQLGDKHKIIIKVVMPPNERLTLFSGLCPSINEFRTIMKYLNIV